MLTLLSTLVSISVAFAAQPVSFSMKGKSVAAWERAEMTKRATPIEIEVWEPHEKKLLKREDLWQLFTDLDLVPTVVK